MKVTIFDIKRFAVHDGPGIRTTVFLKGCPLRCAWCHNPESQEKEPVSIDILRKVNGSSVPGKRTYGEEMEVEELVEILARDSHFYEESGGGITFSGGEPLMQPDGLAELLKACKRNGFHTTVDTCGHARWKHFAAILPLTDLFLFDLKHMDPELHKQYTGKENGLILSNADKLLESGASVIFRIPVIPAINTTSAELEGLTSFLKKHAQNLTEVHLLPYHRIADNKYRKLQMDQQITGIEQPDKGMMGRLKKEFERTGLEVRIGG